jgi:D-alanyl-D-alanine carboxypeptidase/D-alanyl-D-alanine-endopeptidase (penicillin-binding protein 4)
LNRRQPVLWIVAVGLLAILALTALPHFIKARAILSDAVNILTTPNASAETIPRPAEIRPAFDAASWYAARNEPTEIHGVLIETLDGKRTYAALNTDVTFNPASLIKLATSLVALKKLGANYRFQTRVFIDGEVDDKGNLKGMLYVMSNDPTFGDAGAALISKQLQEHGIKRLNEISVSPEFCFNFSNSPEESAGRLAKALKLGNPKTTIGGESKGPQIMVVNSNPLSDMLLYMNARSSNFMADKISALFGGAQGVQQFLIDELKLAPGQVTIATASGREHNRMTPRDLLTVIRALVEEAKRQGLEPADIMPVAADDAGTLRRRFQGTELEGAVIGKTGTLTAEVDGGMASLAGLVYTHDAGPIAFVILDQGNRIAENRELEDQLLTEVIRTYSVPQPVAGPTPRRLLPSTNVVISEK